jgi:NAD(P)-dependent dehydrogenase (short-subunit alcohol dehydrogenase family)
LIGARYGVEGIGIQGRAHLARVDEIAAAVAYLAGPDTQYVNGTTLTVGGGYNT